MNAGKILFASVLAGAMSLAPLARAADKGIVGVAMPTEATARWIDDGNNMVKYLTEAGYTAELRNAGDDIPKQLAQIEELISKKAKVLVIGAIDGSVLNDVLKKAADKDIKVISYDRMITKSKNVDYYATFNNFEVGVLQAGTLVDALKLKDGKGPYNIELFGGSPDDTNAFFFYDGAMSVLKPYIDSGKLVIRSRQMGMDKIGTQRWDGAMAQARMKNLLDAYFRRSEINAVLAPNDGLAIGILTALKEAGYCTATRPCPYVTGQDAEIPSIKSIIQGEQYSTVFKDTRVLAKTTVAMVDAIMSGKTPEINDTKTYNNGTKILPSYLIKPVAVDKSNYKKILIDSGYIKENQLQ